MKTKRLDPLKVKNLIGDNLIKSANLKGNSINEKPTIHKGVSEQCPLLEGKK